MTDSEVRMSVIDELKELVAKKLSVDISQVTPEAKFTDDLGADSLDLVELVMELEEHFEIEISDEDSQNFQTVSDVAAYVQSKKNA
jgi:acyl carrier protein